MVSRSFDIKHTKNLSVVLFQRNTKKKKKVKKKMVGCGWWGVGMAKRMEEADRVDVVCGWRCAQSAGLTHWLARVNHDDGTSVGCGFPEVSRLSFFNLCVACWRGKTPIRSSSCALVITCCLLLPGRVKCAYNSSWRWWPLRDGDFTALDWAVCLELRPVSGLGDGCAGDCGRCSGDCGDC